MVLLKETHHNRLQTNYFNSFKRLFLNKKMLMIIIAFSFLAIFFNLTINGPFISLYAKDVMSLNKSKINLLTAILFSILGGKIIDKLGGKKILMYSILGMVIAIILWSPVASYKNLKESYTLPHIKIYMKSIQGSKNIQAIK